MSPMTEIANVTALQSQVTSLATQNIGIRCSSKILESLASPDSLSPLGPTNQGDINEHKVLLVEDSAKQVYGQGPPRHAYSEPWDSGPCFTSQAGTTHSKRDADRGDIYSQVPMSPRREIETEHNTSIQRSPMGLGHRLPRASPQLCSTQAINVPHHLSELGSSAGLGDTLGYTLTWRQPRCVTGPCLSCELRP